MDADRWARLNEIVPDALERPPTERAAFLDAVCRDAQGQPDDVLRAETESLLAAHTAADADDVLTSPFAEASEPGTDLLTGARVGPWRLDARIGAGGMGVVYRAHRADGLYTREVALKRLRFAHGAEAALLAHRLQAERRLLAPLEHPGIARLYDGGVDETGAPYLVTELVHGVPLTAWAAGRGLGVPDRIRLFLQVCEAVAYAHHRLVVHRDLKPSNILVAEGADGQPEVKLLDFGIAKLLDADAAEEEVAEDATGDGGDPARTQGALTPAYAAPEQLRHETITTATDVYALGVLLYELLTGQRPYDLTHVTMAEAERLVRETAPPPPSSVARTRTLRGDLDAITLKAMGEAPHQRYPSADALADDLRRYLDGLPVEARPATAAYRLSRFAGRHRAAVAAAAAVLLALVGGLGVALWQGRVAQAERDAAERRFAVASEAARALLYDVHDAVADLPGSTAAREVIVSRSLDYLARLAAEAGGDHALRLDLAAAYLRVGNVLGNPNDHNLGRLDDARASYRRGLALLEATPPDSLRVPAAHLRGVLYEKLADVAAFTGAPDSALGYMGRALTLYRRNAEAQPERPERRVTLAIGHLKRGDYAGNPNFPNAGRPADALRDYDAMLALLGRTDGTDAAERLRLRGIGYERLGTVYMAQGDLDTARDAFTRSLAIREDLGRRDPTSTNVRRDVGIAHEKLGEVLRAQGRLDEALAAFEAAAAVYWALFEADPQNAQARRTLAIGYLHLGDILGGEAPNLGDAAAAHNHFARALALLEPVAEEDPTNTQVQALMDEALGALGALP